MMLSYPFAGQSVSLLCAQKIKSESSRSFIKNGWEILMSGLPTDKHHGVGFCVSRQLRLHVTNFVPRSFRIAEITFHTLPHPITILNVYAPKTDNALDFASSSTRTLIAYTDGSCPNNRAVSYHNPAGWGFVVTHDYPEDEHPPSSAEWTGSWGPVKSDPQSIEGLSVGSNNTGELRAVIELFDYLLCYSSLSRGDAVVVQTVPFARQLSSYRPSAIAFLSAAILHCLSCSI